MRGRRPRPLSIAPADLPVLQQIARAESLPWYQVRRARIVLANSRGVRTSTIAFQMQCDEATVWRTRRRYEREGLTGLLAPPPRSGSPGRISPPPTGPDRRLGLPGAGGQGPAHHPLVQ
jgi:Winged helix-turn helix